MRYSALAGFLASAVFVSGSAGFASTFLAGPHLGAQMRHNGSRAALMSSAAPVDPLAALQVSGSSGLEGEPPASQKAHRLRNVENTTRSPVATVAASAPPPSNARTTAPVADSSTGDMPGPITEEAFAPTAPSVIPAASGGPLIATETTSAMVSSKLENGEPVLTLRIAPVVAAAAPAVDSADPDNAVEATVISVPPSEQALATPAISITPASAPHAQPVAPPPARVKPATSVHPRVKPALSEPRPEPVQAAPRRVHTAPARVTTIAAPAPAKHTEPEQTTVHAAPADPLNAPYMPEEPAAAPAPSSAPGASAPPAAGQAQPTGGPTPLVMPQ